MHHRRLVPVASLPAFPLTPRISLKAAQPPVRYDFRVRGRAAPGKPMTASAPEPKIQLRKTMGFWDVMLFNIATVLGPRWIAAAGHNGPSSISLWVLAAVFFFVPGERRGKGG